MTPRFTWGRPTLWLASVYGLMFCSEAWLRLRGRWLRTQHLKSLTGAEWGMATQLEEPKYTVIRRTMLLS